MTQSVPPGFPISRGFIYFRFRTPDMHCDNQYGDQKQGSTAHPSWWYGQLGDLGLTSVEITNLDNRCVLKTVVKTTALPQRRTLFYQDGLCFIREVDDL